MRIINKNIEAITLTDDEGYILPMKIRIKDKKNSPQVYDITKIYQLDVQKHGGNTILLYNCDLDLPKSTRRCVLRFERDTRRWNLFKIT